MRGGIIRLSGGLTKPKDPRLGVDIAGRVEAVGKNVVQFHLGDEVFGTCDGGFAEYATTSEKKLALKPTNVSFEEAAATGVCSTRNLEMVRSIGADHVIDYTKEDFTKNGKTYDVIFDVVGKSSFSDSIRSLNERGFYLLGNGGLSQRIRGMPTRNMGNKKVIGGMVSYKTEELDFLKQLIEAGKIKSTIDRRYPLEQTVEAHRYVETGQKTGDVV